MARLAASARFFSSAYFSARSTSCCFCCSSSRRESLSSATLARKLLLAVGEALLALLQHGDVGADADIAAVAGAALVDMKPAAVLDLRLVGAGVVVVGAGDGHALGDDRLGRRGDNLVIGAAGAHHVVGEAVELLIFAVAHDQPVVPIPQHESLGDGLHRIAKPGILVGRTGDDVVVGDHGDAGEARLAVETRA